MIASQLITTSLTLIERQEMNGREKTQLQIERGTRTIVENVDQLRMTYGFDNIQVLTPIVETRLRSGLLAARPLKTSYQTSIPSVQIIMTIPMTFPKEPSEVAVTLGHLVDDEASYNASLQTFATIQKENGDYDDVKNVLERVQQKIMEDFKESMQEFTNEGGMGSTVITTVEDDKDIGDIPILFYSCRRCRYCLLDSTTLHSHSLTSYVGIEKPHKCSSLFVEEPPVFMTIKDEEQEGKLVCPKCETRVGQWSWIGSKCSCGEWITPAYQFTKSKLDERKE